MGKPKRKTRKAGPREGKSCGDVKGLVAALEPSAVDPLYVDYLAGDNPKRDKEKLKALGGVIRQLHKLHKGLSFKPLAMKAAHKEIYEKRKRNEVAHDGDGGRTIRLHASGKTAKRLPPRVGGAETASQMDDGVDEGPS